MYRFEKLQMNTHQNSVSNKQLIGLNNHVKFSDLHSVEISLHKRSTEENFFVIENDEKLI